MFIHFLKQELAYDLYFCFSSKRFRKKTVDKGLKAELHF